MKAVAYSEILKGVWDEMGWETNPDAPGEPLPNSDQWHSAKRAISKALERVTNEAPWKDIDLTECRRFAPDYDPVVAYEQGEFVYFPPTDAYYQALVATTGNQPASLGSGGVSFETDLAHWSDAASTLTPGWWKADEQYDVGDQVRDPDGGSFYQARVKPPVGTAVSNSSYWTEITEFDPFVPWEQAGKVPIGLVIQVYASDPRRYRGAPRLEWAETSDGIQIQIDRKRGVVNQVWVKFLPRPARLTGDVWDAAAMYSEDSEVSTSSGDSMASSSTLFASPSALAAVTVSSSVNFIMLMQDGQTPTPIAKVWFVREVTSSPADGVNVVADKKGTTFTRV